MNITIEVVNRQTQQALPFSDLPRPGSEKTHGSEFDDGTGWDLCLTADPEMREEISALLANGQDAWGEILDVLRANGLDMIDPERIVAYTEAPLLGQYAVIEDDGRYRVDGRVWKFESYMIMDPMRCLAEDGKVKFDGVGLFENVLFPPIGSQEYNKLSLDAYESRLRTDIRTFFGEFENKDDASKKPMPGP